LNILHENCDPKLADDKSLPYTAYLIQYQVEENNVLQTRHDIAMGGQAVELFDHYYDKYKKNFKWLKQSEGRVPPSHWNNQATPPRKKRKRRKADEDDG
tara:strand:- start:11099 stop:11395 length:297 start_codon:yes stop_codon:yes gene_type:complete